MSVATQALNSQRIYKVINIDVAERPSVRKPIKAKLDKRVKICLERAKLVTESYRRTENQPWIIRRARGLDHLLRHMIIYILEGKNKKLFTEYLKTWFSFDNWHIQFNCIDNNTLKDAMHHPEIYDNLIVRVAGYSAFFTELTPGIQEDIIARTEQDMTRQQVRSC